ncbi:TIGR01457 family HAD-type hydrolase [Kroppenstedtia pulmonis]|uniref:TIGR01457 family HAD-type hydrolase n=1 Tax=Kroppenstedtia pulmonis TaxID=1380685 RepID=A0A7D3XLI0_9BACL|nr:TIGR01457 family HAD-type hydrolase [Kroppenstedtia pulmonis]QKG83729.1 TIGR01457 family HAD-type hydrolase [Kroppenstedtia pulmonis]
MPRYTRYLIDLDGTLYRGKEVIEGGLYFLRELQKRKLPFLYVTNNSSTRPEEVAGRLQSMGYPAEPVQVITSSMAMAHYLRKQEMNRVYVIGEAGLVSALQNEGIQMTETEPDAVVVGIDRQFTYDKMKRACLAIRSGAHFYGTNSDRFLPTEEGMVPGNGSLCCAISAATGVEPVWIGKPEAPIMDFALERIGGSREETLIVGDNLNTDILAGQKAGVDSLLVFSGVTHPQDYKEAAIHATYTVNDLREWTFV